jgi:hypothetical protein
MPKSEKIVKHAKDAQAKSKVVENRLRATLFDVILRLKARPWYEKYGLVATLGVALVLPFVSSSLPAGSKNSPVLPVTADREVLVGGTYSHQLELLAELPFGPADGLRHHTLNLRSSGSQLGILLGLSSKPVTASEVKPHFALAHPQKQRPTISDSITKVFEFYQEDFIEDVQALREGNARHKEIGENERRDRLRIKAAFLKELIRNHLPIANVQT